jgi:2-dehydro-3-deoxyphosphooctonate aldolase (KDO 8-P synthase)
MILLAGPCVIESEEAVLKIAKGLEFLRDYDVDFYFKASFDKANRTSLNSFRGLGLDRGLQILQKVKDEFGYKLITDIHESYQAKPVAEVVDILQIPAFLCRQTDLLVEAANQDVVVNIKKGQFLSGDSMKHPVTKVLNSRGVEAVNYQNSKDSRVWLTERGNSFGYGNLVVDMRNLQIMREFAPVLFDATHSVQMPSSGSTTSGDSSFVAPLARAAASVGVDGFFFETHYNPKEALSDGVNMVNLDEFRVILDDIIRIREVLNR